MSKWQEECLGELATIEIGGTPPREITKYWARDEQDGHTWVSIADLGSRIVSHSKERITELGVRNSNVKRVPKGTLIMSFKLSIGRAGIAGTDLYTNEAIAAIVPANHRIDAEFLYHVLPPIAKNAITDNAVKGVTLNKQKLRSLLLRFPQSLNEQKRIAEILSTIDKTIAHTEALIQKYQQIKAGLMHDLFTRGITSDGQLRPPREQAPELYKDSAIGWIPKEWSWGALSKYLNGTPKNGYSPREIDEWNGCFALGLGCLTLSGYKAVQLKSVDLRSAIESGALLEDGDFLVSRANTPQLVGLCGVYQEMSSPCIYPDLMMRIQPNKLIHAKYLEQYLLSAEVRIRLTALAVGTSASMVKLNSKSLMNFIVAIPKEGEQKLIVKKSEKINKYLNNLESSCSKLKEKKSGLMHDLLTGKVPVTISES